MKIQYKYHLRIDIRIFLIGIILIVFGCNSTRFVPEDKLLLNKVEVRVDNKNIDKTELESYIRQKSNTRILGIAKFRLGLYNLSRKKRSEGWLKRVGEPPAIYDEYQRERAKTNMLSFLKNKGYYDATVNDQVEINKARRKVNVIYDVHSGFPYTINKITWNIRDERIKNQEELIKNNSPLKPGVPFDVDVLDNERQRITNFLKNQGYFKFDNDNISFLADSTLGNKKVDLSLILDRPIAKITANNDTLKKDHSIYSLDKFYIFMDYEPQKALADSAYSMVKYDTLKVGNYYFLSKGKRKINPNAILNAVKMKSGEIYNSNNVERTYNSLASIRQFKFINVYFEERESADTLANKILDCYILLTPQTLQSYTFDVEGTNSSGNYGFAGNLNYQHRNIFRGAELLNVRFKGALEKQLAVVNEAKQKFNTREYGVETDLVIPRFWAPLNAESFSKYSMPLTRLSLSYNYQKRPDYTRTIANSQFGYDWRTSAYSRHQFNLIDFNIVHLFAKNEAFVDSIKNLYIRSSYIDHLILATNYTYTYSTQNLQKRTDYSYFRLSFETAGNSLYLLNRLMNSKKEAQTDYDLSKNYYKFLNTPFAQYAKLDLEYRRGFILDYINSIVFRSFLGVALPYGNFDLIPFEKQYFTGGANGIRAWKVRSLGPGTYSAPNNVFPNQSSDIKLEANAEYRFKLFWKLEGALFLDAGNIWSINDKDNRPGAVFKFDQFYKQIAMGTGVGTRFDFTYFIIRVDLGIKMRDPAETVRTKWRIFDGPLKQDNLNLTFAIGYPF